MKLKHVKILFLFLTIVSTSCVVSKKKYLAVQTDLEKAKSDLRIGIAKQKKYIRYPK